jgi:hypothetical protein
MVVNFSFAETRVQRKSHGGFVDTPAVGNKLCLRLDRIQPISFQSRQFDSGYYTA